MARSQHSWPGFRPALLFPVSLILVASLYALYWNLMGTAAVEQIGTWAAQRRAEGYQISYDKIAISGFPGKLILDIDRPYVESPAGGWMWRSAAVTAALSPFGIGSISVTAKSGQDFRLPPHFGGVTGTLSPKQASAEIDFDLRGAPEYLSLTLEKARIEGTAAPVQIGRLSVSAQWIETPKAGQPTIALTLDGKEIDLPPSLGLPLGPRLAEIGLKAGVLGTISGDTLFPALSAWREAGGTLAVETLTLRWEPLSLVANGTVALDEQLQPIAALTARIQGFFETVDGLTRAGLVRPRDASMTKVVLGMMAKAPPGGGRPAINLPLTIQDRILFAGPVQLVRVGDVRWSADHIVAPARPLGSGVTR